MSFSIFNFLNLFEIMILNKFKIISCLKNILKSIFLLLLQVNFKNIKYGRTTI